MWLERVALETRMQIGNTLPWIGPRTNEQKCTNKNSVEEGESAVDKNKEYIKLF